MVNMHSVCICNVTIMFSTLLQFLNQAEYLKGIDIYESIIKDYSSYVKHTSNDGPRDEL